MPEGDSEYAFHYQDHLYKYHFLRPFRTKKAGEVANHLSKIFIDFGARQILQNDNMREFTVHVFIYVMILIKLILKIMGKVMAWVYSR